MFEADSAAGPAVDPGLEGQHHAALDDPVGLQDKLGSFGMAQADGVAGVVDKLFAGGSKGFDDHLADGRG